MGIKLALVDGGMGLGISHLSWREVFAASERLIFASPLDDARKSRMVAADDAKQTNNTLK
jgi:hypothetical protein